MENVWLSGNLSDLPFPFLLFRIWNNRLSGTLEIETEAGPAVDFKNGDICVPAQRFSDGDGIHRLKERAAGGDPELDESKSLQDLMDTGRFTPEEMWKTLRALTTEDLTLLFDVPDADYAFHSEHCLEEHEILFYIPILDLILDGIRRMTNYALIAEHLPGQEASLKPLSPDYLKQIPFNAPEIYLYHVIKEEAAVAGIYDSSRLGRKETQKILYTFFALGVVGLPHTNIKNHDPGEISQADIYQLLESFNHTFESIFKYISKEIGPASLNVLQKCLEETKSSLSPLFQNLRFDPNGRIEINSVPITSAGIQGRQLRQVLVQDLNEILAAEILAVKKILGNAHEAVLIKNLGRVMGWN
jgi:hypothetical protein